MENDFKTIRPDELVWEEVPTSRVMRTFWTLGQYCLMIFPSVAGEEYHVLIEDNAGAVHISGRFTADQIKRLYDVEMQHLSP